MTDQTMKKLLAFAVRNRESLCSLLNCFQAEDLEYGLLRIPEQVMNLDLKDQILQKGSPYLTDYQVTFQGGHIFLEVESSTSQMGVVKALYQLQITDFVYQPGGAHRVTFLYQEDVSSEGGFLLGVLMRAAGLTKGTYLKLAAYLLKIPGVEVDETENDEDVCAVDLEQLFQFAQSPLNRFCLEFQDARDGELLLRFNYTDG